MVQEEVGKYAGFLKIKQSNNTEMICLLSEVFVSHSGVIKKITTGTRQNFPFSFEVLGFNLQLPIVCLLFTRRSDQHETSPYNILKLSSK